ncbi:unnamed protein product [Darwinula stevensoni]|uniref:Uncharacterized protein n=1 Tax=Darwinula stevensoni TaxID=69355 RepID=A0A7R8ZXR2_9CRUS|nr:unnamed protein product [Darwinula stevensoni]CAG0878944.1 unnamed protein product [Darwinula stevensoni]
MKLVLALLGLLCLAALCLSQEDLVPAESAHPGFGLFRGFNGYFRPYGYGGYRRHFGYRPYYGYGGYRGYWG